MIGFAAESTLLSPNEAHARKTKVSELQMTFLIDQKIVRFDVTMNNLTTVQVFYPKDHFCHIFLGPIFWKSPKRTHQRRAVATIEILHHQEYIVFTRKRPVEFRNKIALALPHKNGTLSLHVCNLVFGNHVCLFQGFDGIVITCRLLFCQVNASKSSFTNRLYDLKILDRWRGGAGLRSVGHRQMRAQGSTRGL